MYGIMNKIINMIYPPRCPYCNSLIDQSEYICNICKKEIKPMCIQRKFKVNNKFIYCLSPFKYTGRVSDAIKRFKFRNHTQYVNSFSETLSQLVVQKYSNIHFDIITAVPLHSSKKRARGYNQSELLAKELSNKLNIRYRDVLKKHKLNLDQHTLSYEERIHNVVGVYSSKHKNIIKGSTILLCDDIITTGNTLRECTKILLDNGAKQVYCITIASTRSH